MCEHSEDSLTALTVITGLLQVCVSGIAPCRLVSPGIGVAEVAIIQAVDAAGLQVTRPGLPAGVGSAPKGLQGLSPLGRVAPKLRSADYVVDFME